MTEQLTRPASLEDTPRDELTAWIGYLEARLEKLGKDRDALAADVERLREYFERFANQDFSFDEWRRLLAETPATSLARHDAELLESWAKDIEQRAEYNRDHGHSREAAMGMGAAAWLLRDESQRLRPQAEGARS